MKNEWMRKNEKEKVLGPSGRGLRAPRAEVPVVGRTWRETQYTQPAPRTLLLDTQAHTLTQSVRPTRTSIYSLAHLKRKTGIQSRGGHLNSIQSDILIYIRIRIHMRVLGFSQSEWKQIEKSIYVVVLCSSRFGPNTKTSFLGQGCFG